MTAVRDAHFSVDGPGRFVCRFVWALNEGRFDDMRTYLVDESFPDIDDVIALRNVVDSTWRVWNQPEVIDDNHEIVAFNKYVNGEHVAGIQVVVRRRNDAWGIVQIRKWNI